MSKSSLLVVIVAGLQLAIVQLGYNPQASLGKWVNAYELTIDWYDEVLRRQPQILYFGDSTLFPTEVDVDRRATSAMLAALLPERRVEGCYWIGHTPDHFVNLLDYLVKHGCEPDVVIVPINIRAFSDAWRMDPGLQFTKMQSFLKRDSVWYRAYNQPLRAMGFFDAEPLTESEYFSTIEQQIERCPEYEHFAASIEEGHRQTRLRDFAYYALPIQADNTLLDSLVKLHKLADGNHAKLVCYITPVDFHNIETHLGPGVAETARKNVSFLDDWMRERGFLVLNLADYLEPEFLYPVGVTSSHLTAEGRLKLANRLNDVIRQLETAGDP